MLRVVVVVRVAVDRSSLLPNVVAYKFVSEEASHDKQFPSKQVVVKQFIPLNSKTF